MEERLQKILAHAGLGSRRGCEDYLTAGRVRVNGKVASLGQNADADKDTITVDGKEISVPKSKIYIALNKPRGVISAVTSPDPRPTVRDLIPIEARIYPVGRLDIESEGLIIMTDDGDLANRLSHPRYGHEKVYKVLVARQPDQKQLDSWRRGIILEDGYRTAPAKVFVEGKAGKGAWLKVVLKEGRKRQIRETGSLLGLPVVKIIRIRFGDLELGRLQPKEWRYLSADEVKLLKGESGGVKPRSSSGSARRSKPKTSSGSGRRSPAKNLREKRRGAAPRSKKSQK
ncbi:MAG: rRNA pseudouridine synthase [Anaerolineae bacterium]|jgi:23S rRNA pseudouridine2605 synthase|nr:rRNA pseudouridine synthase [Anaerolineae bacterium]MBT7073060.1 rRNA pseudouridine synthase [Anaerolineae bacterium]MBT7323545.1 rRNA pseudouridine synthase [Anaerolineae bacterium]